MPVRILIVDDEPALCSMVKLVLESHGYAVSTAASRVSGTAALSSSEFDVVITDMKMETDTAGFDVVRAARAHPRRPAIVIMTAYPILAQDWRQAGADALVQKPMSMSNLLAVLERLLRERRA